MASQRTDIQALRGFAVLIVLIYHAKLHVLKSGFIGVDVFFVISGFLITGSICNAMLVGRFSFYDFYFRRARRILPAACVTFFIAAIASHFLLTQSDLEDFRQQLLGAVTFTANIVLSEQSGYFDSAADLKPLLHVWSLSIEEQYYLILPLALFLTPKRLWLYLVGAICIGSLAYSQVAVRENPTDAFFLIQSRAWELMIGSIGALAAGRLQSSRIVDLVFWPALVALLVVPWLPASRPHPGIDALIVCVTTLIVILRQHALTNTSVVAICAARVGDFSYSLYLVHWPLFAFLENVWFGSVPVQARVAALLASLVLGYLLYVFVEQPFRRIKTRPHPVVLAALVAIASVIVLLPVAPALFRELGPDFAYIFRENRGLAAECGYKNIFTNLEKCRSVPDPTILVWGDSHAMHLVAGLAKLHAKLYQTTASACAPFLGVARMGAKYDRAWGERCIAFNDATLASLAMRPSIKTVVLAGQAASYLSDPRNRLVVRRDDGRIYDTETSLDIVVAAFVRTIEQVRKAGRKVIVVASPPFGGFDVARCAERLITGKLMFGAPRNCEIEVAKYKNLRSSVLELYDRIEREGNVHVIRPSDLLCDEVRCRTVLDGKILYRDSSHLSYDGSELVAERMNLPELIEKLAK